MRWAPLSAAQRSDYDREGGSGMARELVMKVRVEGFEDPLTAHVTLEGFEDPLTALEKMGVFRESVKMEVDIKGAKTGLQGLVAPRRD